MVRKKLKQLAPIVLFIYNRLATVKKTVEALQKNLLAKESHLEIFSDGWKGKEDQDAVLAVREYIKTITGFKSIIIHENERNLGLARNIEGGVSEVIKKYGRVIVLEDDILTSPYFLKFMNDALNHYQDIKKVWHISGWNYPIKTEGLPDIFLYRAMDCWGWGTWADRWECYNNDVDEVIKQFDEKKINDFDLNLKKSMFWLQVMRNKKKEIKTWAIFWYATIFLKGGLCLNPAQSFTHNIGFGDDSTNNLGVDIYSEGALNLTQNINFNIETKENFLAVERIRKVVFRKFSLVYLWELVKLFYKSNKKIHIIKRNSKRALMRLLIKASFRFR